MSKMTSRSELPEIARYTRYYEHDGLLRAYANRTMLLAMIFGLLAMASLGFAIYVRVQPPTVVRVDQDGNAYLVGGPHWHGSTKYTISADSPSDGTLPGVAPTDLEGRAVVRQFLTRYLACTPDSVDRNLAQALNMMTVNLRVYSLNKLREEDTVGKIKNDHVISDFAIRSIEHVKGTVWSYAVFGVKEIHRVRNGTESTDQIVGRYDVRLVETTRSEINPSGLLVAEYAEQQMVGEREAGLQQQSALDKDRR
jgi:type IV secretory pathway TrbF-like protein